MIYKLFNMLIFIVLMNFSMPIYAKSICAPLRNYDIDIISEIMSQSLEWQRNFNDFLKNNELSPYLIEKILKINPEEELVFSISKNEVQLNYFPTFPKYFYITFKENKFLVKEKYKSNYKKINKEHYKFFDRFIFDFIKLENYGLVIIYDKLNRKNIDINFNLLSARYTYLCPLNIDYPFEINELYSPYGYKINYRYVGYFIFEKEQKLYKLKVYKSIYNKQKDLFSYFIDESSSLIKFLEVKRKRDNVYILDFNKSYFPYCIINSKIACPKNDNSDNLILSIFAGQKLK